jgi:hypothetical protein
MKHFKILGLLAVSATASLAFAGTAAATTVTSNVGTGFPHTPTVTMTANTIEIHAGGGTSFPTVVCHHSLFHGKVESHGAGVPASGAISALNFNECTQPVTVLQRGFFKLNGTGVTNDGKVRFSGGEIRIHTSTGPVCTFKTSETDIGTLTGGEGASLDVESATLPASGFLCPSTGVWTGIYKVTSPTRFSVH